MLSRRYQAKVVVILSFWYVFLSNYPFTNIPYEKDLDIAKESLGLVLSQAAEADDLGSVLPQSTPCYAFYLWNHEHSGMSRQDIFFIYSCPSSSAVKSRMMYASGVTFVLLHAKKKMPEDSPPTTRTETSDVKEVNAQFLRDQLGLVPVTETTNSQAGDRGPGGETKGTFARPKGPGRRR